MFCYTVVLYLNQIENDINNVNISDSSVTSLTFICSLIKPLVEFKFLYFSTQIKYFIQRLKCCKMKIGIKNFWDQYNQSKVLIL